MFAEHAKDQQLQSADQEKQSDECGPSLDHAAIEQRVDYEIGGIEEAGHFY